MKKNLSSGLEITYKTYVCVHLILPHPFWLRFTQLNNEVKITDTLHVIWPACQAIQHYPRHPDVNPTTRKFRNSIKHPRLAGRGKFGCIMTMTSSKLVQSSQHNAEAGDHCSWVSGKQVIDNNCRRPHHRQ